jgi:hypothetical protein
VDMELEHGRMTAYMKVIGWTIKRMGEECKFMQMEKFTYETIKKTNRMVMVYKSLKILADMMASG